MYFRYFSGQFQFDSTILLSCGAGHDGTWICFDSQVFFLLGGGSLGVGLGPLLNSSFILLSESHGFITSESWRAGGGLRRHCHLLRGGIPQVCCGLAVCLVKSHSPQSLSVIKHILGHRWTDTTHQQPTRGWPR